MRRLFSAASLSQYASFNFHLLAIDPLSGTTSMAPTTAYPAGTRGSSNGLGRLEVLDGLRGYFLVFMLLNHLSFQYGYYLVKINHGELGFVQDAPGFVFLSGLLIGMVYTKRMVSKGFGAAAEVIWKRAFELFCYSTACILTVLAIAHFFPAAEQAWDWWLGKLVGGDATFVAAAVALVYQPAYMDILPQYIVYLLAAPPLLWLCLRGHWHWVLIASALLWLTVQVGLYLPLANGANDLLGAFHEGLVIHSHFNMLAWQAIFMTAMVLGLLTVQGTIDWRRFFDPSRTGLFAASAMTVLFFMVLRLSWTWEMLPKETVQHIEPYVNRTEFGPIYLINFVALAHMIGWLIVAGPQSVRRPIRLAGRGLNWLFRLRFLRLLGRHSLQVYAYHVVLVYLLALLDRQLGPLHEIAKNIIALLAVASLTLPALIMEWRNGRKSKASALPPAKAVSAGGQA
jgi:hypothetical protein